MGCPRLTYREKEERFNFLGLWKKRDGSKSGEDFYPFGLAFNSYSRENTVPQNFLYNGKEQINDLNIDWYDYGARMYMPETGRWGVIDPLTELSRRWSPYTYAYDNPIRFIDPDGMYSTEEWKKDNGITDNDLTTVYSRENEEPDNVKDKGQRDKAVEKAKEYASKNPGNSYEMGAKGGPGDNVDCAGLVSGCIKAGGEKDPVEIVMSGSGIERLAKGCTKVSIDEAQEGNFVTLDNGKGPMSHGGIITKVKRDSNGKVTGFIIVDSGGDPDTGKSGPRYREINFGGGEFWDNRVTGVYKWDTKPDGLKFTFGEKTIFVTPLK